MEIFENYQREIKKYKLLTAEEEQNLSKEIQQGNKAALNKLVQANLRLVVCVAKKFSASYKFSIMDLIQEGNFGLMAAAAKYNYSFNTRFSTYAYAWIFQYMIRFVQNKTSIIDVPQKRKERIRMIENSELLFAQEYGRKPTRQELAAFTALPESEIAEILGYSYTVTSLDIECGAVGSEDSSTIGDLIPDDTYNPEEIFFEELDKKFIETMLSKLSARERLVVRSRYNLDRSNHSATLRELSQSLGVSAETVRQMEIRAVRRLKKITEFVG